MKQETDNMKRNGLCYAKTNSKWHLASYIDTYEYRDARRVLVGDNEWIVKPEEFCTPDQYQGILRAEFENKNQKFVVAFRAAEKPVKAKIAREIGYTIGTLYSRLKTAKELGVDLSYAKPT